MIPRSGIFLEKEETFGVHCPCTYSGKLCTGMLKPTSKTLETYECNVCGLSMNREQFLELEKEEYEEEDGEYFQDLIKQRERELARKKAGIETEE